MIRICQCHPEAIHENIDDRFILAALKRNKHSTEVMQLTNVGLFVLLQRTPTEAFVVMVSKWFQTVKLGDTE